MTRDQAEDKSRAFYGRDKANEPAGDGVALLLLGTSGHQRHGVRPSGQEWMPPPRQN